MTLYTTVVHNMMYMCWSYVDSLIVVTTWKEYLKIAACNFKISTNDPVYRSITEVVFWWMQNISMESSVK